MRNWFIFLLIAILFFQCQNKEENPKTIVIREDTSTIKTLDDNTLEIASKILSYEHNFTSALARKSRDKGLIRGMYFCHPEHLESLISSPFEEIQRISYQPINLENKINTEDSILVSHFDKQRLPYSPLKKGEYTYYPIQMTNTLCLACHGKPYLEVQTEHYNYIKANYASQPKAYKLKEIMAYWKIK